MADCEGERRFGVCARCGGVFDLRDGGPAPLAAKVDPEPRIDDKKVCWPCYLLRSPASGWEV